jgi:hypothetical protein
MSKTPALKKELQRLLETINPNVYYEEASKPVHPYIVYEMQELTYEYGKTLLELEMNVIDYGKNTTTVDSLADTIQYTLNKYYFINTEIQFVIYKDSRKKIEEEDKKIIRRRLTFEIHLHELKGE